MMKKIVYFFSAFLLAGCFGGYSPESKFYRLQGVENVEPISNKVISVGVDLPELPEYVDRPQMVSFADNGSEINIDEVNRWGDDLDVMLQRVVADDLRVYLPKANVKAKTSLLEKYKYVISMDITKFEMIENKEVIFEALWSVKNGSSLNVVYKGTSVFNMPIEEGYDDYVKVMSEIVALMSKQIAESLAKH